MKVVLDKTGRVVEPEFKEASGEEQVDFIKFTIDAQKEEEEAEN